MTDQDASPPDALPKVGILTVSDRASKGIYEDRGGPTVKKYVDEHFEPVIIEHQLVPDEQDQIEKAISQLASTCCLVITTGGTGPAPRDITPEATEAVCDKMLPGFGEVMRAVSFKNVPTAILSRQTAGLCGSSLVVNLPGKPKAIAECMEPILQAIPPCIRLAGHDQLLKVKPEFIQKGKCCGSC